MSATCIAFACSVPDDLKVNPGPVETIAQHPSKHEKVGAHGSTFLCAIVRIARYRQRLFNYRLSAHTSAAIVCLARSQACTFIV